MVRALALLEAAIDFSDEASVSADTLRQAQVEAEALHTQISRHLEDEHRGELIRDGFQVVLAGPPNVGKSTLLNALAQRDVAIVSAEAGTTRDVIDVKLDLGGLPILVSDTAGIREASGEVEQEGIKRALARAQGADLVLWLVDAMALDAPSPQVSLRPDRLLVVVTKFDLLDDKARQPLPEGAIAVSALTGLGLDQLTWRIAAHARARIGTAEGPALTQARHRQHLSRCRAALSTFLASPIEEVELRAEDLRRAAVSLGRITGVVDVEEVLGEIFGRFCIGK
jgi:tRNA modification GTPase